MGISGKYKSKQIPKRLCQDTRKMVTKKIINIIMLRIHELRIIRIVFMKLNQETILGYCVFNV